MKELRIRVTRRRVALLAAAVAVAATGSIGWAAVGDGGTIQGCVAQNGTIDALDETTLQCKDRQTKVEWYTKDGAETAFVNTNEPARILGYEKVDGPTVRVLANEPGVITLSAACPVGKVPLSGGHSGPSSLRVFAEDFVQLIRLEGENWVTWREYRAFAFNGDITSSATAWVVCANA